MALQFRNGEFIATVAVGHLAERRLDLNRRRAGEVVSRKGDMWHLGCRKCPNICKVELEEVYGHEREQHHTRRQLLIPSPLQTKEKLLGNTG